MIEDGQTELRRDSGAHGKLTDWENEPQLQDLKFDVEGAKTAHDDQMAKINHWNDLMEVKGSAKPKAIKGRSQVQPKLIRRQAEWRYSALSEPFLGSDKLFKVDPTSYEDREAAQQNEVLLNWQFRTKLNKIKFIDDFVRSTVDDGTCIVRTGWKRVTAMVKKEVPVFSFYAPKSDEDAQQLQTAVQMKEMDPREYEEGADEALKAAVDFFEETGQATVAVQTGVETVEVEEVLENRPDLEVYNPQNVMIDPSCNGDISKAMFVVFTFETSQSELKKDKRYKNLDWVNWEGASPNTETDHHTKTPTTFQFKDAARKKVVAYEYWGYYDIEGNGKLEPIVCTWIGNTIIRMERNPFPDEELPLVVVNYLPKKRELYGEPDAELLEDNQKILGAVSRGMIDLLGRSANSQQGFAKGMLDPLNRRRFENGQDYEFNPNANPQMGHIQHKFPELPQSAMLMLNLQNAEAEALTGVKSFSGGMSGEAYGDVAAGIRGVLDAASKREMAIVRRLAKGITEIGKKIIAMNAEFLSEEEVVRVTNEQFVTIKREDLKGEFDLKVDISTAEVESAQVEKLAFLLQTIGPDMDLDMRKLIMSEIARLQRMPDLQKRIEEFQPQADPLEEKKKELEIAELEAKIEDIRRDSELKAAKAKRELAEADLKDLDFVEQETGTKHARDVDRMEAQSRGNQDAAITKALTEQPDPTKPAADIGAAIGHAALTDRSY